MQKQHHVCIKPVGVHAADRKQIMGHTYCNIEHHACCNPALISSLEQVDGFSELKSHAKANVFRQMLNKMSMLGILK